MSLPPPNLPPPAPPAGPPPLPAPGPAAGSPPAKGGSGCLKVLVVVAILFGLLVAAVGVLVVVGGFWFAKKVDDAVSVKSCPFLSDSDAASIYGSDAQAQELSGFTGFALGVALDTRGLPDATSCVVTQGDGVPVSRIAESTGGKAAYDEQRQNANPVTEDRGNGLSVTTEGWFADDVSGVGDEAFCTSSDLTGAVGILARKGDRVLYVSVQPTADSIPSDLQAGDDGVVRNPQACERAQEIAKAMLG